MTETPPPPIRNSIGFAVTITLFVLVFLLMFAKSFIHKKCQQWMIENQSLNDHGLAPSIKIERPRAKTQRDYLSQTYPSSTHRSQIYETSINHYIAAIRVPLIQVAITVLLYSYPLSELSSNLNNGNITYNIVFHSVQIAALLSFYVVSNMDPGIIAPHPLASDINTGYEVIDDTKSNGSAHAIELSKTDRDDERQNLLNDGDTNRHSTSMSLSSMLFPEWFRRGLKLDMAAFERTEAIEIECEWSDDSTVPESYCKHCYYLRPIRAKHCHEMGYCIARYDHYCHVIENAVGANNLRFVVSHLLLDSVTYTWQLCMFVFLLVMMANSDGDTEGVNVMGWILAVLCSGFLLILSLVRTIHLLDHIQTISKNQTIAEKLDAQPTINVLNDGYHDYSDDDREIDYHDRYFDEGFCKNWFLCLSGYKENVEYMEGIRCLLKFDHHFHDALLPH